MAASCWLVGKFVCPRDRYVLFENALPFIYVEFRPVVLHANLPLPSLLPPPHTHTHTHAHPFHDFVFVSMRLLITRLPAFHDNYFNYVDAAGDIYRKLIENPARN